MGTANGPSRTALTRGARMWYDGVMHTDNSPAPGRARTTMFLGQDDHEIIRRIVHTLGVYGVENRSQAVRAALRYWAETHPVLQSANSGEGHPS
jgi:hypothetical protein